MGKPWLDKWPTNGSTKSIFAALGPDFMASKIRSNELISTAIIFTEADCVNRLGLGLGLPQDETLQASGGPGSEEPSETPPYFFRFNDLTLFTHL